VFRVRRARVESRGIRYLATRFSAKEAFSKAIGMGIHMPMTWRDCEILNERSGKPYIALHGELAAWFAAHGLKAHVSVTDESDYVSTFVVVETLAPGGDGPPELGSGDSIEQRRPD
jgi:holo-[acyl-carrier protein] synthase